MGEERNFASAWSSLLGFLGSVCELELSERTNMSMPFLSHVCPVSCIS